MEKKLVSVIVPVFNAEKYIERCLKSILEQTYENIELIIVNDGSTDSSKELCEDFSKKYSNVTLINKTNGGVSSARNVALSIVNGDYVFFADSDDWMEKEMISEMISSAAINESDIVVCEYNNFYEESNKIEKIYLDDYNNREFKDIISDEKTKYGGFPWNKLIRRSIIKHLYKEDIHYYENLLFFLENAFPKMKFSVVHKNLYNYCINDSSAVHSKKYSIKKLTTVQALQYVINVVSDEYKDFYKFLYISRTYENLYYISKQNIKETKIEEYVNKSKLYYKDVMKSDKIDSSKKIKIFIKCKLFFLYKFFKDLKN